MPSFFPKGGFKGAAGSRRTFFKEQGQGLSGKAQVYLAPLLLGLYFL
jgi:hypothetical protein